MHWRITVPGAIGYPGRDVAVGTGTPLGVAVLETVLVAENEREPVRDALGDFVADALFEVDRETEGERVLESDTDAVLVVLAVLELVDVGDAVCDSVGA